MNYHRIKSEEDLKDSAKRVIECLMDGWMSPDFIETQGINCECWILSNSWDYMDEDAYVLTKAYFHNGKWRVSPDDNAERITDEIRLVIYNKLPWEEYHKKLDEEHQEWMEEQRKKLEQRKS